MHFAGTKICFKVLKMEILYKLCWIFEVFYFCWKNVSNTDIFMKAAQNSRKISSIASFLSLRKILSVWE